MGTQIKMVTVAQPRIGFHLVNTIRLSARAARKCINDARIDPCDLGLIINTGIYRYKNTGEPAIAALIQERIGTSRTFKKYNGTKRTFSFDLNNGGCGLITGLEIVNELLSNGEITYGMVVSGDAEPFFCLSKEFSFNPSAAAIILGRSANTEGFSIFRNYAFPEYSDQFSGSTSYNTVAGNVRGRNILYITQKDSYLESCVDCALKSLFNFMDECRVTPGDIDLIITSQSPRGFIDKLKESACLNGNFVDLSNRGNKTFHTAGVAFALKKVWDDNRFRNSGKIIFLAIGSGINVSLTLYKN